MLAIGGVNGRSSLLFLDAATVRDKLKANPWIAEATVLKLYPGQLQIDIVERSAFALWQQDGRLSVIVRRRRGARALCVAPLSSRCRWWSARAPTPARGISSRCSARYPQVRAVTKAAIFVGERRWNLRLKDGLDIRLPENDVGNALAALEQARQGRPAVLARHRRRRHAPAGPADGAIIRKTPPKPAKNCSRTRSPKKKAGDA